MFCLQKIKRYFSEPTGLILFVALFATLFDNASLWKTLNAIDGISVIFMMSQFILLIAMINFCLSLVAFKYLLKPLLIAVLMIAAGAAYFMDVYGIIIDASMIQNVFETDSHEATELLTVKLGVYLFTLGVLPSYFVLRQPVVFKSLGKELITRLIVVIISLLVVIVCAASLYKDFSIVHRQHKNIRMMANPTYPIYAFIQYLSSANSAPSKFQLIGEDATHQQKAKKSIVVFVLGETARAQAFQLNGYARNTNPKLSTYPIINFPNTWSCGTSTAESVPCMFSLLDRKNYSVEKARAQESLLDVLKRAGVDVLWRDNNSDCKGACDRIGIEDMRRLKDAEFCNDRECFDEVMLKGLQTYIDKLPGDAFIVLHQKGSHGPEYYRRTPEAMKLFKPECNSATVTDCSRESIVNAYDNTIVYTDFFLSRVIDLLQRNSKHYDTAMLYMSDHGESLGEKGVYLHGFPYLIAPEEQRHIPFIVWFSPDFSSANGLDLECIKKGANNEYTHDNLFHTALGLFSVSTKAYQPNLDAFDACRHHS